MHLFAWVAVLFALFLVSGVAEAWHERRVQMEGVEDAGGTGLWGSCGERQRLSLQETFCEN